MTFKEFLDQYYTEQTVKSYCYVIEKFKARVKDIDEANYKEILQYISKYKIRSYPQLAALKKYYDYLIDMRVREDHPCKQIVVKHPAKGIQFQDLFTIHELELLLKRENRYSLLKFRNQCIISLLIYQGLTPANLTNLRLKDIDLEDGRVYVKQTPKIRKRLMVLNERQLNYFSRYFKKERPKLNLHDSDRLFLSSRGENISVDALNRILRILKPLFPDKNLNARSIRQSVISNWMNKGQLPLEEVQLLSGQKWLSTTEKYKRADIETDVAKINRFFPNNL